MRPPIPRWTRGDEQVSETVDDWEDFGELHRPSRAALSEEADRKHDAMQNMASRPRSLHDDLADQIGFLSLDPTVRALAEYIIHNLDESGFLHLDLNEILRDFGGEATMAQADEALGHVQKLDPPGVGARSLKECLLLQLSPETPMREVLHTLVANHLDDIQQNRLPMIEKKTGLSIDLIKEGIEHLRRLNPRPGAAYTANNAQYVVPDLIVEPDDHGEYQVRLQR